DPQSRKARQRPAVKAEIEEFLDAGRVKDRDEGVHEGVFALMREGRGFAGVVITRKQQNAAMARRAGRIPVLEDIARTVDARSLAVPHGKDAVILGAGEKPELLAAPDRGRRQILVDAGLKADVVFFDEFGGTPEGLVETAQRRAAIAGNVA